MSVIGNRKIDMNETQDSVKQSAYCMYNDIETIDSIEQVAVRYPLQLALAMGNATKYLSKAPLKNGHENLTKAKLYVDGVSDLWEE